LVLPFFNRKRVKIAEITDHNIDPWVTTFSAGRYFPDFPYVSLCGRERNFLRCDDVPIVFTQIFRVTSSLFIITVVTALAFAFPQPE
jgi:hypothetical protein